MTGAPDRFSSVVLAVLVMTLAAPGTATGTAAAEPPAGFALHDSPQPVPEIRFEDGQGKTLSLADFRGKVVLLNIWATWCAPCRREMPTLERLQAELGGPDFEVVALSIDRKGLPVVKEFYEELGLRELGMYVDASGKAPRELRALGVPTTLLIDRDGNEVGRLAGPAEWDSPEMVAFIRSYIGQQSGAALGRESEEVRLARGAVRPVAAVCRDLSLQRLEGSTCNAEGDIEMSSPEQRERPSHPWPRTGSTPSATGCAVRKASPSWPCQRSWSEPRSTGAGWWRWASPRCF
jgi:thiol-disulfide isomerase/thioredoxin